jgi:SAM-dependent methyltransferase
VAAFEIVEHVEHDDVVLGEIARVLRPRGILLLSVPIRASMWSPLDDACGHVRRYEPEELFARLAGLGIDVGGYEWSPAAPPIVYRLRARVLLQARPLVAKLGQAIVFPVAAAWDARFGHLRWHDPAVPVPEEAEHLMLWARRSAGDDADPA